MNTSQSAPLPHVLLFPLPLQGPIKAMLMLAELLCQPGIQVTFLNTEHDHRRLLRHSDTKTRFSKYPNFHLETISDGLPEEHPRSIDTILDLFDNLRMVTGPLFREMMNTGPLSATSEMPVTFIIADGALEFVIDVSDEVGIPLIIFDTVSPCSVWTFLSVYRLIDAGELPFKGEDLDVPIRSVPGMESFLRRRDLPEFYRVKDLNMDFSMNIVMREGQRFPRGHGLILNTFENLDEPILSHIKTVTPNIYPIGPLHTLQKSIIKAGKHKSNSSSLWQEDHSCISWLDSQPIKSVLYISFGSLVMMAFEQLMEFWHGVVNSGQRFLWIRRPDSTVGMDDMDLIPKKLVAATKERGCIVSWGPQEAILAHPSIGGFLTHSGWNSTLESIVEGVPMLCWPCHVDQQVNSRYVNEVWKVGIDMKDTCDRVTIEKNIRVLMDPSHNRFTNHSNKLATLARESVIEGGSSVRHLNRLIDDIKSTSYKLATTK